MSNVIHMMPQEEPALDAPPPPAPGVELLGEYEGSGFKQTPYLVRRGDGQVLQLPRLLYLVAEAADGRRDCAEIAAAVGEQVQRRLGPDDVRYLVDERLVPIGVLGEPDAPQGPLPKSDPLLALKWKTAVVPQPVVQSLAALFSPFFFPSVVGAALTALVGLDVWLFAVHGVAQSVRAAFYEPGVLLLLLALVALSAAFHECGHAAATRYGGARPGAMGVGMYLAWPAFYTDITDAYRLGRAGRLRADLGGVYFNVLFMLATAGAYLATGFEPLLLLIPIQHLEILHQFLPFLRLDGYYIVSDLTGVPDMFSRIKPTLRSLVPGSEPHPRVQELKVWARVVVTAYVLALVPVLAVMLTMMAVAAPRVFATATTAGIVMWHRLQTAIDLRQLLPAIAAAVQLVVLAIAPIGVALTLWKAGTGIARGVWRSTATRPRARNVLVATVTAVATGYLVNWWSSGVYRPIAAGERGTAQQAFAGAGRQLHVGRRHSRGGRRPLHPRTTHRRGTTPTNHDK